MAYMSMSIFGRSQVSLGVFFFLASSGTGTLSEKNLFILMRVMMAHMSMSIHEYEYRKFSIKGATPYKGAPPL